MKVIKKTKDYVIYQKSSGRYAIKDADKNWVNADEKIKILLAEKLIKAVAAAPAPKKTEEAPAAPDEAPAEEASVEEAPAEEAPAEEAPAEEAPAEEAPAEEAPAEKPKPKAKAKAKPKAKAKAAPKKD